MRAIAGRQHGCITRRQLLALGFSGHAIDHRIARGRLYPVRRGVYTVGLAPETREGQWMAAVLSCGPAAALSHENAAAALRILPERGRDIHISVPAHTNPRGAGIVTHRRSRMPDLSRYQDIPVTSPTDTLLDIATRVKRPRLEAALNEADVRDLIDIEQLRRALDSFVGRPGVAVLRQLIDRSAFVLTDSELERRLLPIAFAAGLPRPETQVMVNGYRVDFYWPLLGLVVEADGNRYHRTAARQERDRRRDHAHLAAGLIAIRFTHAQIYFEPDYVRDVLITAVSGTARVTTGGGA